MRNFVLNLVMTALVCFIPFWWLISGGPPLSLEKYGTAFKNYLIVTLVLSVIVTIFQKLKKG
ncbi:MAG: hypothetical protein DSY77_06820 [Bacteroidetes bacterium]|nr:MAG: hypothetical protein DSY77_06820 [Bacteroidota bacterium]